METKPFQFRLSTLVWLVFASALLFGTLRYIRSASGEFFLIVLMLAIMGGPVVWLFTRPNPLRGRRRMVQPVPQEPAAPLEERLQQFLCNVSPTEPSPPSGERTVVLPTSTDGRSLRPRSEIGQLLRRIQESETSCPADPDD